MRVRQSNFELLRLLCMFFVLLLHTYTHILSKTDFASSESLFTQNVVTLLYALSMCAVNVFVLITGYFSVQVKFRSLMNLYLECAFYGLVGYCFHAYMTGMRVGRSVVWYTVFCFSHQDYLWLVKAYLSLYLLAPLLNKALDSFSRTEHLKVLLLLTVINVYFGFSWGAEVNNMGYCLSQFVYMYCIGRYLHLLESSACGMKARHRSLAVFFLSVVTLTIIQRCVDAGIVFSPWSDIWRYNHPLVIVSSVSLFVCFSTIRIKSRIINWLAPSSLAIYLLHENEFIRMPFYDFFAQIYTEKGLVVMGVLIVLFFVSVLFVDKIRQACFYPLMNFLERLWNTILANITITSKSSSDSKL